MAAILLTCLQRELSLNVEYDKDYCDMTVWCNDMKEKGFTLVEIIVAFAIFAASVMIIISIIPTSVLSIKKAEDMQAANSYGLTLVEERRNNRPSYSSYPVTEFQTEKKINSTVFTMQRDLYAIDIQEPHRLYDIVVTIRWARQPQPLVLTTRVYYNE